MRSVILNGVVGLCSVPRVYYYLPESRLHKRAHVVFDSWFLFFLLFTIPGPALPLASLAHALPFIDETCLVASVLAVGIAKGCVLPFSPSARLPIKLAMYQVEICTT